MSTVAIIPARGGSKGVPQKNIRLLKGYPLIAYSIACAKLAKNIDRVIVSTDSEDIANISRRYGAEVPFLRPAEYAADKSPDIEFVLHAINWFQVNEKNVPRYLVHLRPTTPLREPDVVDKAIIAIVSDTDSTSLRSGHPAPESPFKWFLLNEVGHFTSIIQGFSMEAANLPRQGFPIAYVPDGYVDVLKPEFILHSNVLHGEKMIGFVSPFCCEVDTIEDFEFLDFSIHKHGSVIWDYLKSNFEQEG